MLIFWCQDLDRGAVLVHAAALGPFFGLIDIFVDHHQMCIVVIQKEEEEPGGVVWVWSHQYGDFTAVLPDSKKENK